MSGRYSTAKGATWAVPKIEATLKPSLSKALMTASVASLMPSLQPSAKSISALGAFLRERPDDSYHCAYSTVDVKSEGASGW